MSDSAASARWEWSGSREAASVPDWMRPGHGRDGARHAVLLHLDVMRRSNARHPEWAYRPLAEIHEEAVARRGISVSETFELLAELTAAGMAEAGQPNHWRATRAAQEMIGSAYRDRHPMTEPPPAE